MNFLHGSQHALHALLQHALSSSNWLKRSWERGVCFSVVPVAGSCLLLIGHTSDHRLLSYLCCCCTVVWHWMSNVETMGPTRQRKGRSRSASNCWCWCHWTRQHAVRHWLAGQLSQCLSLPFPLTRPFISFAHTLKNTQEKKSSHPLLSQTFDLSPNQVREPTL